MQKLVRVSPENRIMNKLISEWDAQLTEQDVPTEALASIRTYEAQLRPDAVYGVFALCTPDQQGGGDGPFDAFVHLNHAFARTSKPQLRLVWSRLAPRCEVATDPAEEHARIFSTIINNALTLSKGVFKSTEIKIYLLNSADRMFGRTFATTLTGVALPFSVSARGSWLHIEWQ